MTATAAAIKFFRILRRCTANHSGFGVYWRGLRLRLFTLLLLCGSLDFFEEAIERVGEAEARGKRYMTTGS
jgi:hypothetical protein